MTLDLSAILPNVAQTMDGTGFLFGAGTSREAGYPLISSLTSNVIRALSTTDRDTLNEVLRATAHSYDAVSATPNIEELSDLVIAHSISSGDARCGALEARLRELLIEQILTVQNPNLDNHCRFFEALKKRAFGLPCTVWIFTTNYDLLLETAAAQVGVTVENGFSGTAERYFNPQQFKSTAGMVAGGRFTPNNQLVVRLVKLHGSISWLEESSKFYERHPAALVGMTRRVMVLPRRKKVMETLMPPYDTLFTLASRVIGSECKYLVSCGYSFSDEHISQQLLLPAMQANRCRLFALSQDEPSGIAAFKQLPNFSAGFSSHLLPNGNSSGGGCDLWKFSRFVSLFE